MYLSLWYITCNSSPLFCQYIRYIIQYMLHVLPLQYICILSLSLSHLLTEADKIATSPTPTCVTRAPIAVAPWPRTLVGDGAPPSRIASGDRPRFGASAGVAWPTLAHLGRHGGAVQACAGHGAPHSATLPLDSSLRWNDERGLEVRQAHHERGVYPHPPHHPLDSSLRWNDGFATRGPIAVAAGARTLVGDGAPPSRTEGGRPRPAGRLQE